MTSDTAQPIRFLLNGEKRSVSGVAATTTLLRYLRETERLTGTKEGCAEGDCGACTVLISENDGHGGLKRRPVNACIQFLPAMNGRAIETVEKLGLHRGADGAKALREAMVEGHASQCGFCTPGFVVQLFSAWDSGKLTDRQTVKDQISGNLCRCTGYGPIIDAGETLAKLPKPDTLGEDLALAKRLGDIQNGANFRYEGEGPGGHQLWFAPENVDDLADTYAAHPDATLVAGATDVGLWVTKQHRDLSVLIDVSKVRDLQMIEERLDVLYFGAGVTHAEAFATLADLHPDLGEMMRRFAGSQIRNAGTVGGNIANGSPIGDLPPCLIALGGRVYLRKGDDMRVIDLERFFIEYGKQDRAPGEFVVALEVPRLEENQLYFAHKISKRFDSDISAVMAAFRLTFDGESVSEARLAFGGMAGVPKRAGQAEAALLGRPFDADAVRDAQVALAEDFQPLSDMRASSEYRLKTAQNLLERFRLERGPDKPLRIAAFETGKARGAA
ncbi:xanthine dehydrogenase small subunit [Fulvimarina sp. MAC3]|uniref:xanthine dehydrogenase small subunit n=1 Tax=Fulvimarina sp. MAC3 TaxID=3148887 RepID=UPI0031FBB334